MYEYILGITCGMLIILYIAIFRLINRINVLKERLDNQGKINTDLDQKINGTFRHAIALADKLGYDWNFTMPHWHLKWEWVKKSTAKKKN